MHFEDLTEGAVYRTGSHVLTAGELHEFAASYDPQPMHLDRDLAAQGPFGDVTASGFQTMALAWRLWVETGMDTTGEAGSRWETCAGTGRSTPERNSGDRPHRARPRHQPGQGARHHAVRGGRPGRRTSPGVLYDRPLRPVADEVDSETVAG